MNTPETTSQAQPAGQPPALGGRLVGPLLFAPGQLEDQIGLVVVETLEDLRKVAATWGDQQVEDDMHACCCMDYDSHDLAGGFVLFAHEKLTRPIVVHELVHAGMGWVAVRSMASEEVQAMSDREQQEYYDEACARVVEHLYEQAEALLWPNHLLGGTAKHETP